MFYHDVPSYQSQCNPNITERSGVSYCCNRSSRNRRENNMFKILLSFYSRAGWPSVCPLFKCCPGVPQTSTSLTWQVSLLIAVQDTHLSLSRLLSPQRTELQLRSVCWASEHWSNDGPQASPLGYPIVPSNETHSFLHPSPYKAATPPISHIPLNATPIPSDGPVQTVESHCSPFSATAQPITH